MNEKQQKAIAEIRRVASLLNASSLSQRDFEANSTLRLSTVRRWFGSWSKAVEAAGLTPIEGGFQVGHGGQVISDDDLLREIVRLTRELGKKPSMSELAARGRFSERPYRSRWGTWNNAVKAAYTRYGMPEITEGEPVVPDSRQFTTTPKPTRKTSGIVNSNIVSKGKVQYGEPMDFRGLRHAPINEQGVVYLFGMVSKELGFLIESVRTAFPDCEGKRCVDEKRQLWEQVLIEFEFRSSNFREHGHNPDGCDVIICWLHDWEDCPLEVVELSSAIRYLPNH